MTAEESASDQYADQYAVAVASSAGGIHALIALMESLGVDPPLTVLVVQHLDPHHRTLLAEILARHTARPVKLAEDQERIEPGTVYLAPPDRHLLVGPERTISLSDDAAVHFVRPSADVLFASVARAYGQRAIACVLTGTGVDGASGVEIVKSYGGTVIAQDPRTAEFAGMPKAAVATEAVDHVVPLADMAAVIRRIVAAGGTAGTTGTTGGTGPVNETGGTDPIGETRASDQSGGTDETRRP